MSRHHCEVATWAAVWTAETVSRDEFEAATLVTVARLGLMSRHGVDVATWTSVWEVAT